MQRPNAQINPGEHATLRQGVAKHSEQPVRTLSLLTEAERHQILVEWNDTAHTYPEHLCLHEHFEAQVQRTPDAIALRFEAQSLTYSQLDSRANQLAHFLQNQGVSPDVLVGLCLERSVEMVVGLLGILKAGGAYVPLDPVYPRERLAHLCADANPALVLTQQPLKTMLPEGASPIVCLDADWPAIRRYSRQRPQSGATPDNLAYVIYTSGSTGKPKGAMNSHRSICNRLLWMQDTYALSASDRVLQKTPYSFDVSVWEFFWPLMVGACLVVAAPELHRDAAGLVKLIQSSQITTLHFVPSMLQIFLEEAGVSDCTSIRQVICSGEALPASLVNQFGTRLAARLHNLYGPTEAAVDVSYWACPAEGPVKTVPIGRPVWNTQLYVLDRDLSAVPVGVPGELYLGGVQLARGYLKRPDMTAEKFVPDPFSRQPGARMYKTGDLVRFLPDGNGNIEYLGRLDHQVKIRGFRIELGEIESALREHPAIKDVVVIASGDTPEKRLIAYVVSIDAQAGSSVLRSYLQSKLPDYMLPATFVTLEALPLTSNGKVDRSSLPLPDWENLHSETLYAAPRDDIERRMVELWEEILGIPNIGIRSNFFELSGSSLLGVRLFARIGSVFGKQLPLAVLFQAPTIEQLAEFLRRQDGSLRWPSLVPIQPNGSKPPLFCMHRDDGLVMCYQELAHFLGPDQPVYGLQAQCLNGAANPYTTVESMAAHYVREIRACYPGGPYLLAGSSFGGILAYEVAQQLRLQGQKVALLALLDTFAPMAFRDPSFEKPIAQRALIHADEIKRLNFKDKLRYISTRVKRRLKRVHPSKKFDFDGDLGSHLPEAIFELQQANLKAYRDYEPEVYPGQVLLLRASEQPWHINPDPMLWWGSVLGNAPENRVQIYDLPGTHLEMLKQPHVAVLAERLTTFIEAALLARAPEDVDATA